jgi:hypothetical protein
MFERLDANDDGKISVDEVPEKRKEGFLKMLEKADKDGDKALDKDEARAAVMAIARRHHRPGWGPPPGFHRPMGPGHPGMRRPGVARPGIGPPRADRKPAARSPGDRPAGKAKPKPEKAKKPEGKKKPEKPKAEAEKD